MSGQQKADPTPKGYADATYQNLNEDQFLKNWWVLAPIEIVKPGEITTDGQRRELFEKDQFSVVNVSPNKTIPPMMEGNVQRQWQLVKSESSSIDLYQRIGHFDYAVAYAVAEISTQSAKRIIIGVGSDDAVRIYLNGNLIHSNWIGRMDIPDDDLVALDLKKGSNQLLIKVLNMQWDWSFSVHMATQNKLNFELADASQRGDLDKVKLFLDYGANIDAVNEMGLTAYQLALIKGRQKVVDYLAGKGANVNLPLPPLDKFVASCFKEFQSGNSAGAAVLISKDGKILYENGFGFADIGNKVPIRPDTKFRICSLTKQFVASAILKLKDDGKISLDDKIGKFIPDFPRANEVTLYQLMTHTSGIPNFTDQPFFVKYHTLKMTPMAILDSIKNVPYSFEPGSRFSYNNTGYVVLGIIVEKVSGSSLGDFLTNTFFKPLGMNNTAMGNSEWVFENEAYGYVSMNGTPLKAPYIDLSITSGSGSIISTVKDLFIWNEALFNGKVLSPQNQKLAFSPVIFNSTETENYGLGWSLEKYRNLNFISHAGNLNGFSSYLERQPDNKVNIIVLCNYWPNPNWMFPPQMSQLISDFMFFPQMSTTFSLSSEVKVEPNTLKQYEGRYNMGNGGVMLVNAKGSELFTQLTGQPQKLMVPISDHEFGFNQEVGKIVFYRNDKGQITHLVHEWVWDLTKANRLPDEQPISLDPASFEKFVGRYEVNPEDVFEIISYNNQLYFRAWGSYTCQLLPASETEFFTEEFNLRFTFKLNGNNTSNEVSLNADGARFIGHRIKEPKPSGNDVSKL